jgi:hypothetical protein
MSIAPILAIDCLISSLSNSYIFIAQQAIL